MVFYRKYRPQTISQLDITEVREKLTSILQSGDIPHAFLFAGPRGLGKTSAARILARAINCENKHKTKNTKLKTEDKKRSNSDIEPCNECDVCKSIINGSNLDVLEIDAASNRGIDEIRELREKIKFAPVSLSKKVYIIDEVHMLTTEAFNALLKTLEEPPAHALFILCTTEPWKLPDTIISRSFYIQFEKPTKEELRRSFNRILEGEKMAMDDDAYNEIFLLSQGSFRDGAKIIEELSLSVKDGKITKELLEDTYKTQSIDQEVIKILSHLAHKNIKEALLCIDELAKNGVDFTLVTEKIVNILRKMLLKRAGFDEEINEIIELNTSDLLLLIAEFSDAYRNLKFAVIPQLPLELVVMKWGTVEQVQSAKFKVQSSTGENSKLEKPKQIEKNDTSSITDKQRSGSNATSTVIGEKDMLQKIIEAVQKKNAPIAGFLRGCKLTGLKENNLELETEYKFHGERLNDDKNKKIVEEIASGIIGRSVNLVVMIKKIN